MGGLPLGAGIELDPTTRQVGADLLIGGVPRRVLRLGPSGIAALAELKLGTVRTADGAALARQLTDAGLAHPRLDHPRLAHPRLAHPRPLDAVQGAGCVPSVTVLIPAYGRAGALDSCLTALGDGYPVVVVDDGSPDPAALGKVAAAHGVRLIRRETNGGPAAARNTGLAAVHTDLVAFLDSDCIPPPDWIDALAAHLTDPAVAAAAPRIVAAPGAPAGARNALDLGPRPGRVAPGTPIAYVPTAALLARCSALLDVARTTDVIRSEGIAGDVIRGGGVAGDVIRGGGVAGDVIRGGGVAADDIRRAGRAVFDPALRYGEDVDLIWRLHAAGWRVRYEPSVRVGHVEPATWPALLARRFRYGSSAAGLTQRHPGAMAPLILEPWTAVALAALVARRPAIAALALTGAVLDEQRVRRAAGVEVGAVGAVADRAAKTWRATGTYATQFLAPALLAGLTTRRTRFGALALLCAGPAHTRWSTRPPNYRVAFLAGHLAEDAAYGAGVIVGSLRVRTLRPLLPVRVRRGPRGILGGRSGKDSTHGERLVRDGR